MVSLILDRIRHSRKLVAGIPAEIRPAIETLGKLNRDAAAPQLDSSRLQAVTTYYTNVVCHIS